MNPFLAVLLLSAMPQSAASGTSGPPAQTAAAQNQQQTSPQGESNRSVLKVTPGTQALKEKDFYARTGYMHPFRRMPKFLLMDQKKIWTSPFHTARKDIKWWAIFGGATGVLIATDKYVSKNAPNNSTLNTLGTDTSYLGEPYALLPIAAGWYFLGTAYGSDHFREAGLLSFEALADVTAVELVFKTITDRQRPLEGNGNGEFEASTSPRYNSSFPSGHAIETMALASVFAHEYPHKLWVKVLAYSYAAGVIGARLAANKHFPGDVMAGGAMGWFIGDYVYAKRHNPDVDQKPTTAQAILSHIRIGGGVY